ncbi:vancomycin resistance protein [Paenibacillus sp. CAA11]|uniref:VanW family protein n=1 Tax=Paenibacillus sp. CAA11 TaxID=1532905 RepID=UPI000D3713DA|nr:VanW family protein [Paenibacillus sp. CAA11]AWB46200.1 vancomycin resistance protein [Paenibacillus sp. CAA11]
MRKWHLGLIILISLILFASLIFGILHLYAGKQEIPEGVTLGGYPVGKLKTTDVLAQLDQAAKDTLLQEVVFTTGGTEVRGTWEDIGVQYSFEEFRTALTDLTRGNLWERAKRRYYFKEFWKLQAVWEPSRLKQALSSEWEIRQFGEAVDARRLIGADDQIRYEPERTVQRIDWEALGEAIMKQVPKQLESGGASSLKPVFIKLPLKEQAPPVTVDSLKQQGIQRRIIQFSTGFNTSSEGRIHNVDSAARAVDGTLLAPGDIFDYEKAIEKAEREYGFREAPVIISGKFVPGVGGGICQVSSTLYGAVIRAGLGIVERRNHSLPVKYLPKGQDATFSRGYINFRFQNTTSSYLLISAKTTPGGLIIKLFGNAPQNIRYSIHTKITDTIQPPIQYISNPSLPQGSSQTIRAGRVGYIVETYRTKYIDGVAQKPELLTRDTYPAQSAIIAVRSAQTDLGSTPGPSQTEPLIIEDGISIP